MKGGHVCAQLELHIVGQDRVLPVSLTLMQIAL
jgi:hypothetical protein